MSQSRGDPKETEVTPRVKVLTIPILSDNYCYLLVDTHRKVAAAVDPAEPDTVRAVAKEKGLTITTVLTTHHHWDHAGGNEKLRSMLGDDVEFVGWKSKDEKVGKLVKEGDRWSIASKDNQSSDNAGPIGGRVWSTPCHTRGHVCYVVESKANEKAEEKKDVAVFTGDTLFVGGCGKFFEGTGTDMFQSLSKLGKLNDDVRVFCGHEYTTKNLNFAKTVDKENQDLLSKIQEVKKVRDDGGFTVPSTIGGEKKWNPFMRVEEESIKKGLGLQEEKDPARVMSALRNRKDNF